MGDNDPSSSFTHDVINLTTGFGEVEWVFGQSQDPVGKVEAPPPVEFPPQGTADPKIRHLRHPGSHYVGVVVVIVVVVVVVFVVVVATRASRTRTLDGSSDMDGSAAMEGGGIRRFGCGGEGGVAFSQGLVPAHLRSVPL
jgi:hypothetical protein